MHAPHKSFRSKVWHIPWNWCIQLQVKERFHVVSYWITEMMSKNYNCLHFLNKFKGGIFLQHAMTFIACLFSFGLVLKELLLVVFSPLVCKWFPLTIWNHLILLWIIWVIYWRTSVNFNINILNWFSIWRMWVVNWILFVNLLVVLFFFWSFPKLQLLWFCIPWVSIKVIHITRRRIINFS